MSEPGLHAFPDGSEPEEALPGAEGTYRDVFENNRAVMLIVDPGTRTIFDANSTACAFYGYDRAEMQEMPVTVINPSPSEKIKADMREAAQKKRDYFRVKHRLASGEIRDVEIYSGPLNLNGKALLLSIIHDVTERQRAEEQLRESEERYRTLIEDAVLGVYRTTPGGSILMVNPALCKMLGYPSAEDLRKRNLEVDGFHPGSDREAFRAALEGHDVVSGREAVWLKADGTSIVVRENARVVRDKSGNVLWYEGTVEDITEKKLAEDRLSQREEQFRMISENVSDMIALLDRDGKRVYNSPSYGRLLGDPEKLRGTNSFQEIHPEDRERMMQLFRQTVSTGIGQRTEYRFVSADGAIRYIESQASTIKSKDGSVINVLIVSRDITEKKALDQQLLRSQRMESIGTLASGIAHDLNNVLSPIMMSIEMIRKKLPSPRDQRLLDTVETSVRRGSDIVKQVLAFGRGVKGERINLQAKHVISEVFKIAGETFPKTIELEKELPKDLWTISADPTQMHQVILNMCVNARDAMPEGGKLTVAAENVVLDENYARMNIESKVGPHLCISVTDTGTGIPASILERIFDPFFTTKDVGRGTGLGLSTALAIVKSHGGFINVYSEIRKGTTFRVYLPALVGEGMSAAVDQEEADPPGGQGELILVVDDEAGIREVTKETLEAVGYRVVTAGDGTEAIALYAQQRERIAAVITDMVMPFMDGTTTIRAIRRLNPDALVVATSGFAGEIQLARASDSGADMFLTKPYTARKLLTALNATLKKGPPPGGAPH
jgi:two-component system, cell cycle sensor histidine kinase and response regulator CckA